MTKPEILTLSLSILVNNYEEYQRTTTELFQKKAKGFDFQVSSCETHKQTRVKGFDSSVLDLGNRADTPMRGNFGGALDAVSKTS